MSDPDLMPCPFCAGKPQVVSPLGFGNIRSVDCRNDDCGASGPWARGEAEAITAWNTRHDASAELLAALEALEAALKRDLGAGYAGVALCQAAIAKAKGESSKELSDSQGGPLT